MLIMEGIDSLPRDDKLEAAQALLHTVVIIRMESALPEMDLWKRQKRASYRFRFPATVQSTGPLRTVYVLAMLMMSIRTCSARSNSAAAAIQHQMVVLVVDMAKVDEDKVRFELHSSGAT